MLATSVRQRGSLGGLPSPAFFSRCLSDTRLGFVSLACVFPVGLYTIYEYLAPGAGPRTRHLNGAANNCLDSCANPELAGYSHTGRMFARGGAAPRASSGATGSKRLAPVLLFFLTLLHCQRQPSTDLLQVSAVLPAEAQFGDSLQVVGDGFALGSPASVTFRGDVYRAAHEPARVDVSLRAETESQRELSVQLPRNMESAFCGPEQSASHATFRGDVQVAIAAKTPGAPPVTGTLHGAVIELYPAVKTQLAEERRVALGRRALAFFGIDVAEDASGGLVVVGVASGSRALSADLRQGDRFARSGGLSVLQPSDLVPEPARVLEVAVLRGPVERLLRLETDGFWSTPPSELNWGAVLLGALALACLGFASPAPRVLGWLAQNLIEPLRARSSGMLAGAARRQLPRAIGPKLIDQLGGVLGLLVWFAILAALLSPVLRRSPIDLTLGLFALMFGAATLLGAWHLVRGGRVDGRWSLLRGTQAALSQCVTTAPGWVALLSVCFETGVDFDEMVRAQGAAPWRWNAFSNPGLLVLFLLLLLTALPRLGKPAWRLAHARPPRAAWRARGDNLLGWLYVCSMCAVACIAFLGGDAWPGQTQDASRAALVPSLASALVLSAKYTGLVLFVSFLRTLALNVTTRDWAPVSARVCVPLSLAAAGLTYGWRSLDSLAPFWRWLQLGFGPASVAAVLLVFGVLAVRIMLALRQSPPPSLSPWL
jgi:NADH-quinone oxidoreductase subunit H